MKKIALIALSLICTATSPLSAYIQIQGFEFNLPGISWWNRESYPALFSTCIGYFRLQKYDWSMTIYGSSRTVEVADVDSFYTSLLPLEDNLAPYATPNWKSGATFTVMSEEDGTVSQIPAKKLVVQVVYPSGYSETVVSYLIAREKKGFFSDSLVGETLSFSCASNEYEQSIQDIDSIISQLVIY